MKKNLLALLTALCLIFAAAGLAEEEKQVDVECDLSRVNLSFFLSNAKNQDCTWRCSPGSLLMLISFRQGMPAAFQNIPNTDRMNAVAEGTVTVSFPP